MCCLCGCNDPKNMVIRELIQLREYQDLIEELSDTLDSLSAFEGASWTKLDNYGVSAEFPYSDSCDVALNTILLEIHKRERWLLEH